MRRNTTWSHGVGGMPCLNSESSEDAAPSFLWCPYVPLGAVTVLDGDPGVGKGLLLGSIIAAVTRGRELPGDPRRAAVPGTGLMLDAYDSLGDTIRPRLESAGADLRHVHCITSAKLDSRGIEELRNVVEDIRPALVTIDPITAYVAVDGRARDAMGALADIAREYRCAVVVTRCPREENGGHFGGPRRTSLDSSPSPRSILWLDRGQSLGEPIVLSHVKSAGAGRGIAQVFRFATTPDSPSLVWDEAMTTASNLWRSREVA